MDLILIKCFKIYAGTNANHLSKCATKWFHWCQNAVRGEDTALSGSGQRSLWSLQSVHWNVLVVDERYVDDLPLFRSQQNSKPNEGWYCQTIFSTIYTLSYNNLTPIFKVHYHYFGALFVKWCFKNMCNQINWLVNVKVIQCFYTNIKDGASCIFWRSCQ